MIDFKNNFIFSLLQPKVLKKFSSYSSAMFYDKRTKTAFRKIIAAPKPFNKYFFASTTMKRIKAIDLSSCHPNKLEYMFEKHGPEIGICICNEDNLGFVYIIGATDIQLVITSGTKKSVVLHSNNFGKVNYAPLMKTIVGACVISYQKNEVEILVNNTLSMLLTQKNNPDFKFHNEESRELIKMYKELSLMPKNLKLDEITQRESPCLFNSYQDIKIKTDKIWVAIQMFIFLKTANVIEQTFISENTIYGNKSKSKENDLNGITVIDSTWDSSVHVINPFAVTGHFRNQPKKNKKNEWYKELIYIDSYMKCGYHRNAKKDTHCNSLVYTNNNL